MAYYRDFEKKPPRRDRYSTFEDDRSGRGRRSRPEDGPDRSDRKGPASGRPSDRFDRKGPMTGKPSDRFDRKGPSTGRTADRKPSYTGKPGDRTSFRPDSRPQRPAPSPEKPVSRSLPVREKPAFDTPFTREPENLLSGRNPIREALKADRDIEKMLVAKGDLSGSAREIVAMARERGIPVQVVDRSRLDEITPHHQGILAYASAYSYAEVDDILALAREKGEKPFIVILDGITDPHNLGAIIRSAACAGAHGVIVPLRRSVGLTPAAVKASAGAVETVKVARVTNLTKTIERLKKEGIWIYAADMDGEDYRTLGMEPPMALVIGSEGEGISRLVLEAADHKVSLPVLGAVDSLNASVAAGILLYEAAFRSRKPD